ncbi:hypothetical protein CLOM_g20104 [Closterium sp. NIES-68]|nr:hypothetical protein CLOM_g20104 [Closterium sp. NIES-68]GJP64146.1 hypothetical protein CLOP_g21165 [Closterium sp. NIES-67]
MQPPRGFPPAQRLGSATRSVAAAVLGSSASRIDQLNSQASLINRYIPAFPHLTLRVNNNSATVASAPLSLLQRFWTATSSTLCNALSPVPGRRYASFTENDTGHEDCGGDEGSGQGSTPPVIPESPSRSLRRSDFLATSQHPGESRSRGAYAVTSPARRVDRNANAAPRNAGGASEPPTVSSMGMGGAGVPLNPNALVRPGIGAVPSSSNSGGGSGGASRVKGAPYGQRGQEREQRFQQQQQQQQPRSQRQRPTSQGSDISAHVGSSPTSSGTSGDSDGSSRGSGYSSGIGSGGTEGFRTPLESPSGSLGSYQHRPKRQFVGRNGGRGRETPGERGLSEQAAGRGGARSVSPVPDERPGTSRQLFGGKAEGQWGEGEREEQRRRKQARVSARHAVQGGERGGAASSRAVAGTPAVQSSPTPAAPAPPPILPSPPAIRVPSSSPVLGRTSPAASQSPALRPPVSHLPLHEQQQQWQQQTQQTQQPQPQPLQQQQQGGADTVAPGQTSDALQQHQQQQRINMTMAAAVELLTPEKRPFHLQGPTRDLRARWQGDVLQRSGGMRRTSSLPKLTSPQEKVLGSMPPMRRFLVDMIMGCDFIDILSPEEVDALAIVPVPVAENFLRRMPPHPHRRMCEPGAGELLFDEGRQSYLEVRVEEDGNRQPKIAAIDVCAEPGNTVAHRQLGRDRILRVTFPMTRSSNQGMTHYAKFLHEGIVVGLRRFHFLGYKGSQGNFKSGEADKVFMFALRSMAPADSNPAAFPLYPSIKDVWNRFAHFHTCPTIHKTAARIELLFSQTYSFMNLRAEDVQIVPDIKCQDGSIPTDGTGLILASLVPPMEVTSGVAYLPAASLPSLSPSPLSSSPPSSSSSLPSPSSPSPNQQQQQPLGVALPRPAVLQVRGYLNGMLFKGTLLLVTQFPASMGVRPGVQVVVRDSMVKVKPDPGLLQARDVGTGPGRCMAPVNKLEVNDTSKAPSEATFNRALLLLLVARGVPQELFLSLARRQCAQSMEVPTGVYAAAKYLLRSASHSSSLAYSMQPLQMLACGIPLSEPYLQDALQKRLKNAAESLEKGHVAAERSYYLMGVADPTGTLQPDQVVVLLKDGPVTGPCVMYRSPSLHPGHLRRMNAVHSPAIAALLPPGARYCVIFPVTGARSVTDTMSGGDLDGDTFLVCFHPQVTSTFQEMDPPPRTVRVPVDGGKAPAALKPGDLEKALLAVWSKMASGFSVTGRAYNLHESYMDEYGPHHAYCEQLVRIYERALDASKTGEEVSIPRVLERPHRPHYAVTPAQAAASATVFRSRTVMGQIYDLVQQAKARPNERDLLKALEHDPDLILFPACAPSAEFKEHRKLLGEWSKHCWAYNKAISEIFRRNLSNKQRDLQMQLQKEHYRRILYDGWSPSFEEPCVPMRILRAASVIYEATYKHAKEKATKHIEDKARGTGFQERYNPPLSFAWKVAGEVLCEIKARRNEAWFLASQKQFLLMSVPGGRHSRWGEGGGSVRKVVTVGPEGRVMVVASGQGGTEDGEETDGGED